MLLLNVLTDLLQIETVQDGIFESETIDDLLRVIVFGLLALNIYLERKINIILKDHKKEIDDINKRMYTAYNEAFEAQEKYAQKLEDLIKAQSQENHKLIEKISIFTSTLSKEMQYLKDKD